MIRTRRPFLHALLCLPAALAATGAFAQARWDLPTAYPLSSLHTENLQAFATDVEQASASLFR